MGMEGESDLRVEVGGIRKSLEEGGTEEPG
ncbi:MAG: hypothetical protein ACI87E_000673 [Mariniblastus sp.]|jgi:hypothetical protein